MNKIFYPLAISVLVLSITGCYKDKSMLQTNPTPEVKIEFKEGLEQEIHIDAGEVLTILPTISAPQGSDLSYKWELSRKAGNGEKDMEVISTERELEDYNLTRPANSSTPYFLRYTVINKSFGNVETIVLWKLYVSPVLADGLLFSYTKDGATSDLGYIKSPEFTRDYTGKRILLTDLLARSSGASWKGLITALNYSVKGRVFSSNHIPYAWAVTADHKLLRFDPFNYTLDGSSDRGEFMMIEEESPKILQFSHNGPNIFMRTEKHAYRCPSRLLNFFSEPIRGWNSEDVSGGIIAAHGGRVDKAGIVWYNGKEGQFKTLIDNTVTTFRSSQAFVACAVKIAEAIAATTTIEGPLKEPNKSFFLLKDKGTDVYSIYEFSVNPARDLQAESKYTISPEAKAILDRRVSVAFAVRQPVLYAATADGINVINWKGDGTTSVNTAAYLSLTKFGKVRSIRFYRQGEWVVEPHGAFFKLSQYNEAALIAVTEGTDGNDQVHFIPMVKGNEAALGALVPESEIITIEPKVGKILDIIPMGK